MTSKIYHIAFMIALLFIASCKKEEAKPSPTELLTGGQWNLTLATVDGTNVNYYDGLTINFTETSYTTTNGGSLWKSSGTWSFEDTEGTIILLDDGLRITLNSLLSNQMTMSFVWDKTILDGGRLESLQGDHVMSFKH